jgi:hypothetical protein
MSSNRSISGARQRRAGEPAPIVGQRSNTSIGGQQIFAKQQQLQRPNNNLQQQPVLENLEPQTASRLSIPKAFTLVTLRLGRLEQYIQQLQEDGAFVTKVGETEVDDVIMRNIIGRLETLEKGKNSNSNSNNDKLFEERFNKLDKEIRETKDLLMIMMMKYEKFSLETNDKFDQIFNNYAEDNLVENIEVEVEEDEHEEEKISAVNLKEEIESELANEV